MPIEAVLTTPKSKDSDLLTSAQAITNSLIQQIHGLNKENPSKLKQTANLADIFQKAITALASNLNKTHLPEATQNMASGELSTLAQGLEYLFSGKVPLRENDREETIVFQGDFAETNGQGKRIVVYLLPEDRFSEVAKREIRNNCQINMHDITGWNADGTARVNTGWGLRLGLRRSGFSWRISIDSGSFSKRQPSPTIRPLSDAIGIAKRNLDLNMHQGEKPYTFYYNQPAYSEGDDRYSRGSELQFFLGCLRQILKGYSNLEVI